MLYQLSYTPNAGMREIAAGAVWRKRRVRVAGGWHG